MNITYFLSLNDAQIISEATAIPYSKVIPIVKAMQNDPSFIQRMTSHDLKKFGITEKMSRRILCLRHVGQRIDMLSKNNKIKFSDSKQVFEYMRDIAMLEKECFFLIPTNRSNRIIGDRILISEGGYTGTVVDVKIIMKELISINACGFALCHNHPSGNPKPSNADITITKKLKEAGMLMDLQLLDHVIVAGNTYYSFGDEGLI